MIIESGFMASANTTPEALAAAYVSTFTMIMNVLPGILLAFCLLTAYSNYVLATIIFRKLNLTMPTVTRLTTYRLPIGFIIGFVIGFAIKVLGDIYLSHVPIASLIGLNITIVFLAFYFFQGVGSISYFIEKVPPSLQTILKVMLFLSVLFTYFRLIPVISCIGVADAMLDFRRLEVIPKGKDNEKFEQ